MKRRDVVVVKGVKRRVLARALTAGHRVRALVRNPERLRVTHENLTVVRGDVLDAEAVFDTVAGCSVVVSVFGHVKGSPRTLQTDGTRLIVAAMKQHGVGRVVTLSGGGLRAAQDRPRLPDRVIRTLLR